MSVSNLMQLRCMTHSSFCSSSRAPTKRTTIRLIGAGPRKSNQEWQDQSRTMRTEAMAELTPVLADAEPNQVSTQAA